MRVKKTEALSCMQAIQTMTSPTISWLEKQGDEFEVEPARFGGDADMKLNRVWFIPGPCLAPPEAQDFARLAAAAVIWGKYVGL